jgi:hypothetical protein
LLIKGLAYLSICFPESDLINLQYEARRKPLRVKPYLVSAIIPHSLCPHELMVHASLCVVSTVQGKTLLALVIKPLTAFPALGFKNHAYDDGIKRCAYAIVIRMVPDTDLSS